MVKINFYKKHYGISDIDVLCTKLCDTLIETNYTYDFFVNWKKVIENRDAYKYQIALLKSIKNSQNPVIDFKKLITKYPEVIEVIPILLACRDGIIKVLDSIDAGFRYKQYNFFKRDYNENEIQEVVSFTKNTGLLDVICKMDSATDYLLGVEVGLDTNARKNRSGLFLEKLVTEKLEELSSKKSNLVYVSQKSFKYIEESYKIRVPLTLRNRKFDYVVIYKDQAINIEVNFYSGTGSKPSEIVSSYINRGEVLTKTGWKFIWLTDGIGWRKMRAPLKVGVSNIDYVINADFLRREFIEKVLSF